MLKKMKGGMTEESKRIIIAILYILCVSSAIGLFLFAMFWYMTAVNSNTFGHLQKIDLPNVDISKTTESYYNELLNATPIPSTPMPSTTMPSKRRA
jgi:hypothetical protein